MNCERMFQLVNQVKLPRCRWPCLRRSCLSCRWQPRRHVLAGVVRLLRDRGTHPAVLRMAEQLHCDACSEARPPTLRHVVAAYETRPGYVLEIDGLHWVHPVTHRHARCQIMTDVASRAPVITVFEETPVRSDKNNTTAEAKRSLLQDWMQHRGRPRLLRMDPDGAYMSNDMLKCCRRRSPSIPR